jgi:hypothetical protein
MGYCYQGGLLCCDVCGNTGGVRKKRCPHGWCQPVAVCPTCNQKPEFKAKWKTAHVACKTSSEKYAAEQAREQELLNQGKAVLCSALSTDDNRVHALFRFKDGTTVGRFMSHEAYAAIDHNNGPVTIESYEASFPLEEAPANFHGATTKCVN